MRSNLEHNEARGIRHFSSRWGTVSHTLSGAFVVPEEAASYYFLNPNGANRTVQLPAIPTEGGLVITIANTGVLGDLEVQDSDAVAVGTVAPAGVTTFFCSATAWSKMAGITTTPVSGPGSSNDNGVVRFDGTSGASIQDSAWSISDAGVLAPIVNDGGALGSTTLGVSDLFFATGAVINWNNGDITLTGSANQLVFAGASSGYAFDAVVMPFSDDGAALGSTANKWSDLFLASGGVINWDAGNYTLSHSAGVLSTSNSFALTTGNLFLSDGASVAWSDGTTNIAGNSATDIIAFTLGGTERAFFNTSSFRPTSNDGISLGASGAAFSDLFLASGAVINFASGDVTIAHSTNVLTFNGASGGYGFDASVVPTVDDGAPLGASALKWSDLFLASGGVINFDSGDMLLTHAANILTFSGGDVTFSGTVTRPTVNDGSALGSGTLAWSDLFLASGAVINFAASNVILTHSSGILTVSTGILSMSTNYMIFGERAAPSAPGADIVALYAKDFGGITKLATFDNSSNESVLGGAVITIAVSDEVTPLTTGTAKVTFRMPFAMKLNVLPRASLGTVSSSGAPAIDINEGGVSIFSTTLTIDANEKTSTTAATPAVLSDTVLADDAEITIDVDTAGTGAKGLKVHLIGLKQS